jgi:hypothetical protein
LKLLPRDHVKGQWSALYVSLNPKGVFTLTRRTWERLGGPKAVHILFDDVNNVIFLKPAAAAIKDAYPFTHLKQSGARRLSAFRLMAEFGIKIKETVQFHDAEIDRDGMLVLDLRSARVSPRAANHWRTRHKKTPKPQLEFPTVSNTLNDEEHPTAFS